MDWKLKRELPPETDKPVTWYVLELEPGLEIAIRSDFKPPATPSEQQRLNDRVSESMVSMVKKLNKRELNKLGK